MKKRFSPEQLSFMESELRRRRGSGLIGRLKMFSAGQPIDILGHALSIDAKPESKFMYRCTSEENYRFVFGRFFNGDAEAMREVLLDNDEGRFEEALKLLLKTMAKINDSEHPPR